LRASSGTQPKSVMLDRETWDPLSDAISSPCITIDIQGGRRI